MYSTEFEKEIDKEGLEAAVRRFQKGDESAFDIIYKNVAKTAFILVNSFFRMRNQNTKISFRIFLSIPIRK